MDGIFIICNEIRKSTCKMLTLNKILFFFIVLTKCQILFRDLLYV